MAGYERVGRKLAVTSGKGGVGKSNISVALALCAARAGLRCAVMDADLGLGKLHVMLGLRPTVDFRDVLAGAVSLAETAIQGPGGIGLIPGASGFSELADLSEAQRGVLMQGIEQVARRVDLLIIDTGAGIGENVVSFVVACDSALVVTDPEPASLSDAYALIKVTSARRRDLPFDLLINKAGLASEADAAARRLSEVCRQFLSISLRYAGHLPADFLIPASARQRKPFLLHAPMAPASLAMAALAERILRPAESLTAPEVRRREAAAQHALQEPARVTEGLSQRLAAALAAKKAA